MSAKVPTYGTKRWIDDLKASIGQPSIRLWEPWFYEKINAGEVESMPGMTLVTIRSAGYYNNKVVTTCSKTSLS